MPIRIKNGTPAQYGRITMPQGTYLPDSQPFSNPSAGATGSTNGAFGTNPIQQPGSIQTNLPGEVFNANQKPTFWQNFWNLFMHFQQNSIGVGNGGVPSIPTLAEDVAQSPLVQPQRPTHIFEPKLTSPSNMLVGRDLSAGTDMLGMPMLRQTFAGRSDEEIITAMRQNGYTQYGGFFVKVSGGSGDLTSLAGTDDRGRPNYVDGASLQPGERVTASSGVSYVGGTPYTDKGGNTSGQYAITLPGVRSDPHGRFKWTSSVVRDKDGNFVRVYRQQLRKVNTQRGRRLREARAEQKRAEMARTSKESQLVSLRANYG